jgi:hypothetical protein
MQNCFWKSLSPEYSWNGHRSTEVFFSWDYLIMSYLFEDFLFDLFYIWRNWSFSNFYVAYEGIIIISFKVMNLPSLDSFCFLFDTVRIWEFSPVWTDFHKCDNLSRRNVKLILKILSDFKPSSVSSNKKRCIQLVLV